MAKATRKQALGRNLSALLRDGVEEKEKKAAILKTENDFLKEQLKDCREQLAYTQNIVTASLAMQQKIIDAFPEKPKKMAKASNKLTIEEARIIVNKAFKIED
tara:strand:+ start:3458 stop:3766 length:309 start_codon:yes stop_codon:yes gene_type:complete